MKNLKKFNQRTPWSRNAEALFSALKNRKFSCCQKAPDRLQILLSGNRDLFPVIGFHSTGLNDKPDTAAGFFLLARKAIIFFIRFFDGFKAMDDSLQIVPRQIGDFTDAIFVEFFHAGRKRAGSGKEFVNLQIISI